MRTEYFVKRSKVPASAGELYAWHARPGAFERLTPPWEPVEVVEKTGGVEAGARVVLRMKVGPFHTHWVAEHTACEPGRMFQDVQSSGPFALWEHTHRFTPIDEESSLLEDHVRYAAPLGALGRIVGGRFIRRKLEKMFSYRHRITVDDLAMHRRYKGPPLRVLVLGAEGQLGSQFAALLSTGGHTVYSLPSLVGTGRVIPPPVGEWDAVVDWQSCREDVRRIDRLREERLRQIDRTQELLRQWSVRPKVVVAASSDVAAEADPAIPASSAAAEAEAAWRLLGDQKVRVVLLRLGVVVGLLAKPGIPPFTPPMPFRRLGGRIDDLSWIALDDALGCAHHCLTHDALEGPVHATAPRSASADERGDDSDAAQGAATRGRRAPRSASGRAPVGIPEDEKPAAGPLSQTGYDFRHPTLKDAVRFYLGAAAG